MYSDKQIPLNVGTIVSFVIQSWKVSESGAISVSRHVICHLACTLFFNKIVFSAGFSSTTMVLKLYVRQVESV